MSHYNPTEGVSAEDVTLLYLVPGKTHTCNMFNYKDTTGT